MKKPNPNKTSTISFRTKPELKKLIETYCAQSGIKLSEQMNLMATNWIGEVYNHIQSCETCKKKFRLPAFDFKVCNTSKHVA